MLRIEVKTFQELSTRELYDLLQLRSKIFVVEQNCVYQDIDGKDLDALHVLGYKKDKLVAYTRVLRPGAYYEEAAIGRVAVRANERSYNYGKDIMLASLDVVKRYFNESAIRLSAQAYLKQFYNNLGFETTGEEYLEDGIPHIEMIRS
jgi:ElaA protein